MSEAIGSPPTQGSGLAVSLRRIFRVPPPTERVPSWHVSPAIDMAAYHFSWLWVLIPLAFAGPEYPSDYVPLYFAVLTFGFIHRHYTLGYVYLDPEIFARHRSRFIWVPLILAAGLLATPYLLRTSIPSGALAAGDFSWPSADFRLKIIVTTIVFGAGLWNIWHTLSQKYGILRIYSAKARNENTTSVPGWVDRLFVMGWLPLIVTYVAPRFTEEIMREFRVARKFLRPLLDIVPEDPRVPNFYILPKGLFGDLVQRWHALGSHQIAGSATTRRWVGSALLLPGRAFLLSRQGSRQRLAAPRLPPAFAATGD